MNTEKSEMDGKNRKLSNGILYYVPGSQDAADLKLCAQIHEIEKKKKKKKKQKLTASTTNTTTKMATK